MTSDEERLNLVQRLAEKQSQKNELSLSERAAEKLAAMQKETSSPKPNIQTPSTPAAATNNTTSADTNTNAPKEKNHLSQPDAKPPAKGKFAEIDLARIQRDGFISPNLPQTRLAEEFRTIKRPLLLNAFGAEESRIKNGNVLMVTSARPGEGKTFTSLNLAMSIAAERDLHVMLIDADVYKHQLCTVLEISSHHGLVDLLLDDTLDLTDVLVRTNIPNLTVLPSGDRHPSATELLASQRMADFMRDIAERYPDRMIIIDAPPVLASSEPGVLALLVGQIVMVVESDKTDRYTIDQSLDLISNCQNINFILNKSTNSFGSGLSKAYTYYDEYHK
ncbi:MAG: AAA family ATPase [Alphaproteobacteria bacterium]|nr:AAA family ATPase [Alphaproteobacteria bacterium]